MTRGSIAGRLQFIHQLSATLVLAAFAASALIFTGRSLFSDETALLRNVAQRGASELDRQLMIDRSIDLAVRNLLAIEPVSHVQMRFFDSGGRFLGATLMPEDALREEQPMPLDPSVSHPGWHEQRHIARCGVTVVASLETSPRENTLRRLSLVMFWIALPLLGLTYLVIGAATRRVLRPLRIMTERVADIPSDAPRKGIAEAVGLTEIDALTRAFNGLLIRLDEHLLAERRFTAEASHELRTPLTVMGGELELALLDPALAPGTRESLTQVAVHVRVMHQLVDSLLLLRRLGDAPAAAAGFEPVNLADQIREALPFLLQVHPERRADVQLELPDEVLVPGEPALLTSAVGNLLENALKFTRAGEQVRVTLTSESGRARLLVEDAGPGIPPAEVDRIFSAFYRGPEARASSTGFGLGLAILQRVARAHGGDVTYRPSPLGGAGFHLQLPLWGGRGQGGAASPGNTKG